MRVGAEDCFVAFSEHSVERAARAPSLHGRGGAQREVLLQDFAFPDDGLDAVGLEDGKEAVGQGLWDVLEVCSGERNSSVDGVDVLVGFEATKMEFRTVAGSTGEEIV